MSQSITSLVSSITSGGLNVNNTSDATLVSRQGSVQTALGQTTTTTATSSATTSASLPPTGTLVGSTTTQSKDLRLVLSVAGATNTTAYPGGYYTGILAPLVATNGVLFPYTPAINFSQDVDYSLVGNGLVHTNQDYNAYQRTPSVKLSITGKFTIQNQYEGKYMLSVIHFFRTVSKMYFGQIAANIGKAGLPPPILMLNGFGTYMFNNLPCLLTSHSFDYSDQIDTVDVPDSSGGITKLPSLLTLTVALTVQQTPFNMSTVFNLDAFRTGALIKTGGGWI